MTVFVKDYQIQTPQEIAINFQYQNISDRKYDTRN